ncbi:hypothetical protein [Flintibacter muris]|jgi:hypothetical protein|uniref:hypothetical protein n=1 Tax=Flintibacter muris TaxID=2941327 RepID=UPI00203A3D7C|nr:hypothetical protein [Flintibacter muris]
MTNRETRELEALLFLFRPYIDKEAQPDYDVVYSRKFGYLFIQFYPEGNGEDQITLLETSHDLLFMMFSWVTLDVLALDLEGEHWEAKMRLFPSEEKEIRKRICPVLEKCGKRSEEYKKLLNRFLRNYPDIFLDDTPF